MAARRNIISTGAGGDYGVSTIFAVAAEISREAAYKASIRRQYWYVVLAKAASYEEAYHHQNQNLTGGVSIYFRCWALKRWPYDLPAAVPGIFAKYLCGAARGN